METDAEKAVRLAHEVLDGSIPLFLGCRYLCGLMHALGLDREQPFVTFIGVESETDMFPILPDDRKNWNPQRLAEKDAELAKYAVHYQGSVQEACRAVIARFSGAN